MFPESHPLPWVHALLGIDLVKFAGQVWASCPLELAENIAGFNLRHVAHPSLASVEDLSIVEPSITTWTFVTTWHDVCCADALALLVTLVVFETLACETQL